MPSVKGLPCVKGPPSVIYFFCNCPFFHSYLFKPPVSFLTEFLYGSGDQPFTAPIMIPFTKYLWKIGYTRIIGITTIIVTVIRTLVGVWLVATAAAMDALLLVLARPASELAWFRY